MTIQTWRTIQSIRSPSSSIPKASIHTLVELCLAPPSSLPLPLPLLFSFSFTFFFFFPNETNFGLKSDFQVKAMFGLQLKPIFGLNLLFAFKTSNFSYFCKLAYHISTLASNLVNYNFYAPFWTNYKIVLTFCNFPGLLFPGFTFNL